MTRRAPGFIEPVRAQFEGMVDVRAGMKDRDDARE